MSNITPRLNAYLQPHKTHCALNPRTRSSTHDEFLKEAYNIATHITSLSKYLRSIRAAYLSTAPAPRPPHAATARFNNGNNNKKINNHTTNTATPLHLTNPDRDAIDANAKLLLRDLSASLRQLSDAETLRRTTFQTLQRKKYQRGGVLARWAAGSDGTGLGGGGVKSAEQIVEEGREETLAGVRGSVLWFLGRELESVAEVQRGMVERRVRREVERGRSVLYLVKGGGAGQAQAQAGLGVEGDDMRGEGEGGTGEKRKRKGGKHGMDVTEEEEEEKSRKMIEEQLTPEQLQVFASENRDMLKHYEDTLDQVRTAERSLLEIAELQSSLVQHLDIQSSQISQLVADSVNTESNVRGGNKELKKASERKSTARVVFWASCALCGVLVGWDLVF